MFHCRPDTTWERENKDFFSPECVNEICWTPVVFARVCKAGKCVGSKFVERYYDAVGCGMLMYCNTSSIVDRTSILPHPMYDPVVLDDEKVFTVIPDSSVIPDSDRESVILSAPSVILNGAKDLLEDALCKASELTSLRIGDFIAVEMAAPAVLARREDGEVSVKGTFCDNELFSFRIIF